MASNYELRTFSTGATRDTAQGKYDYEGFLNPLVLECFAEFMHKNRVQPDGSYRASDNWQLGIPKEAYMKSGWRHFHDWWKGHRRGTVAKDALCAVMFNVMGYLLEVLKDEEGRNRIRTASTPPTLYECLQERPHPRAVPPQAEGNIR